MLHAEWPFHLPQLINPFKHFLWILKTTHAGADLDTALVMARGSLGAEDMVFVRHYLEPWLQSLLLRTDYQPYLERNWRETCRLMMHAVKLHTSPSEHASARWHQLLLLFSLCTFEERDCCRSSRCWTLLCCYNE